MGWKGRDRSSIKNLQLAAAAAADDDDPDELQSINQSNEIVSCVGSVVVSVQSVLVVAPSSSSSSAQRPSPGSPFVVSGVSAPARPPVVKHS